MHAFFMHALEPGQQACCTQQLSSMSTPALMDMHTNLLHSTTRCASGQTSPSFTAAHEGRIA